MTPAENDIYIYRNYLYPLRAIKDFEIADKDPDVRGWDILGNDGRKFGTVHELIVDIHAMKVRYLDIDVKAKLINDNSGPLHVLIPIGTAILNKEDRNVIVPQLNLETLKSYPVYKREPVYVLRDYERSVRDFFANGPHTGYRYDPAFYEDKYYDTNIY